MRKEYIPVGTDLSKEVGANTKIVDADTFSVHENRVRQHPLIDFKFLTHFIVEKKIELAKILEVGSVRSADRGTPRDPDYGIIHTIGGSMNTEDISTFANKIRTYVATDIKSLRDGMSNPPVDPYFLEAQEAHPNKFKYIQGDFTNHGIHSALYKALDGKPDIVAGSLVFGDGLTPYITTKVNIKKLFEELPNNNMEEILAENAWNILSSGGYFMVSNGYARRDGLQTIPYRQHQHLSEFLKNKKELMTHFYIDGAIRIYRKP